MSFMERIWAYVTLGATGAFVGEASPLIGGLAAFDRRLHLALVIAAVSLGTWLGLLGFYVLGRWQGRRIRKRWPKLRPLIVRSIAIVRRHPWRASLLSRYAYGLRVALPIACGVGRLPIAIYAAGTAVSVLTWTAAFTIIGWALGRTTERLIGQVREYEPMIGAVVVLLVALFFLVTWRKRVAERTARVLDPPPDR